MLGHSRLDAGRLFQTRGRSTAKDQSPNIVLVDGTCSFTFIVSDDDDLRPGRRCLELIARCEIWSFLRTVTDKLWRHFYFRSTIMFSALEVCYENALGIHFRYWH